MSTDNLCKIRESLMHSYQLLKHLGFHQIKTTLQAESKIKAIKLIRIVRVIRMKRQKNFTRMEL